MTTRRTKGATPVSNQIRIIAGHYRRRLLQFPDIDGLRPTPDRVRETLFNWLGQELHGYRCLDLFAGSGALGFEAASRGAARVVMVEMAAKARQALQLNRNTLGAECVEIIGADATQWLARNAEPFDLIFLDPPFASNLLAQVLPQLARHLAPQGHVYLETATWPAELAGWEVLRQGTAGAVRYGLLRLAT